MTARQSMCMLIVAALALGAVGAEAAPPTKTQICEAAKNTAAGAKALCLELEHAKVALGKLPDFGKCATLFTSAFGKIEQQAGGQCPTEGDAPAIEAVIDACVGDVAAALSGSPPPPPAPCAVFPGDGASSGPALSYTDNSDGTATDNNTGFMWEVKDNNSGVHDVDNNYSWSSSGTVADGTLFTDFLDTLNNRCDGDETTACASNADCTGIGNGLCGHVGHRDWRIPNVKELQSIVDYGAFSPAIDPSFPGLTAVTAVSNYWSSTTFASFPSGAWLVDFANGFVGGNVKDVDLYVRAVRGGSP